MVVSPILSGFLSKCISPNLRFIFLISNLKQKMLLSSLMKYRKSMVIMYYRTSLIHIIMN